VNCFSYTICVLSSAPSHNYHDSYYITILWRPILVFYYLCIVRHRVIYLHHLLQDMHICIITLEYIMRNGYCICVVCIQYNMRTYVWYSSIVILSFNGYYFSRRMCPIQCNWMTATCSTLQWCYFKIQLGPTYMGVIGILDLSQYLYQILSAKIVSL